MPYVETKAPGLRYGMGTISGAGTVGQLVKVSDDNVFMVNDDPAVRSFGLLVGTYTDGEMCGVYCMGGIFETDQFAGDISAGDELACDADTGTLKAAEEGEFVVGEAISVASGVLRFKLLV
eukprot:GHVR01060934.1.p3 GENE.GHVR01060934.1~~GHVR01060934.1.p3  ORF type:complete len:121 (+),score=20.99 GHVR01060934.1:133-495(+)